MQFRLLATGMAVLGVVSGLAAGCGGGGYAQNSSPTSPSPTAGAPAPITITITSNNGAQSFSPNPAMLGGQMVVFRNNDTVMHRVRLNDESLDTGDIPPGGTSRAVQMPAAGANYHCVLHPSMVGAVGRSTGEPPPPCAGYC